MRRITEELGGWAIVFGIWAATAAGCVLFLCGVDSLAERKPPASPASESHAQRMYREQRDEWAAMAKTLAGDLAVAHADKACVALQGERDRTRADVAEAKLAACERRIAAAHVAMDAARRDAVRVVPLGDEPGDRLPPQGVPER